MIAGLQDVYVFVADMDRAVRFYTEVLGLGLVDQNEWWSTLDCDGLRFGLHGTGGDPDAVGPDFYGQVFVGESSYSGIMDASKLFPAEVPSFWQVYITVDDVDATVKQVESLGGGVMMAGEETPYGTLAAVTDPFGAVFCLGHPPAGWEG